MNLNNKCARQCTRRLNLQQHDRKAWNGSGG